MTARYSHMFDIAFEVVTDDPNGGTFEERLAALKRRVQQIESDPVEARGALMDQAPFDTFEVTP